MPTRYIVGVGDPHVVDGAEAWAASHAFLAGIPLVRVHVGKSSADATHRHTADGSATRDIVHVDGPVPEALAHSVGADDILVLGTGKTGFIRSRVFGALSLQIVAEVGCTVAVIPEVDLRFRTGIVAGVKNDDLLPAIVRASVDEARALNEPMQVIHSSFTGLVPSPIETSGSALDRVASVLSMDGRGVATRTRGTTRPPAEALLDASRNASLLVIGAGHRRGVGHALGTVTHDVLVNVNAPVLIVRLAPTDNAES